MLIIFDPYTFHFINVSHSFEVLTKIDIENWLELACQVNLLCKPGFGLANKNNPQLKIIFQDDQEYYGTEKKPMIFNLFLHRFNQISKN